MKEREDPYAAYDAEREADHQELADESGPVYVEMHSEPSHPPRTLAEYMEEATQVCPVPLPEVDELLADPEMSAEADRVLAGEDETILGIPFAPSKRETERGE